jgi:hypothetical protein
MSKEIIITIRQDGQINLSVSEDVSDIEAFGAFKMAQMQMEMVQVVQFRALLTKAAENKGGDA